MKVIFLDIDGVMNSHIFYENRYKRRWRKPITYWYELKRLFRYIFKIEPKGISLDSYKINKKFYTFDYQFKRLVNETCPLKWKWLIEFCNENDVKICISSVWKRHFGDEVGIKLEWWNDALVKLGFNPNIFIGITPGRRTLRGEEIQDFLIATPEITDYAILDDDSDILPEQMSKFHQCDSWFGMSPNHLYKIKRNFDNAYKN